MPTISDEAIVIKVSQSGEANQIVHFLGRDRGCRTAFATYAKKSKKRFVGGLQPYHHLKVILTLRRTQDLYRLDSAEVLDGFPGIKSDLSNLLLAGYFCELLDLFLVEGESYPEIFDLMLFFLGRLGQVKATLKHRLFFELKLLDLLGYCPDFISDPDFEDESSDKVAFDCERLKLVRPDSDKSAAIQLPLSCETRRVMQSAISAEMTVLGLIKLSWKSAKEALGVTRELISANISRRMKSVDMLDKELLQ